MKKTFLILSVLLSLNANAGSLENLNSSLKMSLNSKVSLLPQSDNPLSIFYGGQDISHPLVAIAREPMWEMQTTFVG
jgi:hypothetical protein